MEDNAKTNGRMSDEKILDILRLHLVLYNDGLIGLQKLLSVVVCYCPPDCLGEFPPVIKYLQEKYGDNYRGEFAIRQKALSCRRLREGLNQSS